MWGVCFDFRCKNCFHKSQNRISTVLKYLKQPLSVITSKLCSIIQRYILFSSCRTNWIKDFKLTKTDLLLQQRNKDGDHMVLIEDLVFLPETLRSSIKALQCRLRCLSEDSVSRPALFLMEEHCYACYEQLVWIKTYYYKNHRIYHFSRRQKITFFDSHLKLCKLPVLLAYGKPKHNVTMRQNAPESSVYASFISIAT